MGILRVRDKSNDEIISVCEIEDLWVNGQPIKQIPTEVNIIKLQNQKAIECLKEIKSNFSDRTFAIEIDNKVISIWNFIDNKIKELEGEKE